MRLEQLVLYGPGEDDRVRFGPGLTVFAGLGPDERADLLETVVDALTGRLASASVIITDREGRRVFADRSGATYAATGARAPAPAELLGRDPAAVTALMLVTDTDLGLGHQITPADVHAELVLARAELERREGRHRDTAERAAAVAGWEEEVEELGRRILASDDERARWAWFERNRDRERLVAELAAFDDADAGARDRRYLRSVDALRDAGADWGDAASAAAELRAELGTVPPVSPDDLARVATTPDDLPADLRGRLDTWRTTADLRATAEAELAVAERPAPTPEDPLVEAFGAMDQARLWPAHDALVEANEAFRQATARQDHDGLDPEAEEEIEAAHLELVRRQRDLDRRFRPGILATGALAVTALLAGTISILLGVATLAAAVAMGWWLLAIPRRNLATATVAEEVALRQADAGSWLGLHLRRLDAFTDGAERQRAEAAIDGRAAAQLDWDEVAGTLSVDDLSSRSDAVRARADAIDPKACARRRDEAKALLAGADAAEVAARHALLGGLDAYGLPAGADVEPERLTAVLQQRIAAGRVARDVRRLAQLDQREADAHDRLDALLQQLGERTGDVAERLERAIATVASARQRAEVGRGRDAVAAELLEVEQDLRSTLRTGWEGRPAPKAPPTDPDLLHVRRSDLLAMISGAGRIDLVGAEHALEAARAKTAALEQRLEDLASGPASPQQLLIARLGRTTSIDGVDDTVPLVLDDPLVSVPTAERMELLDQLVRLSNHVQLVLLTADPVAIRWARDRCRTRGVVLYEATTQLPMTAPTPVAARPVPVPAAAPAFDNVVAEPVIVG